MQSYCFDISDYVHTYKLSRVTSDKSSYTTIPVAKRHWTGYMIYTYNLKNPATTTYRATYNN